GRRHDQHFHRWRADHDRPWLHRPVLPQLESHRLCWLSAATGLAAIAKRGDAQGGAAERFETPLVGGAARLLRRGRNLPAPAFPRRGNLERGRPNSLLPQATTATP